MSFCRRLLFCLLLMLAATACKDRSQSAPAPSSAPSASAATVAGRCEHGLPQALCTKCNPALAAVFKAKGDWCAEHQRPESQCALCNPELAKKGVK